MSQQGESTLLGDEDTQRSQQKVQEQTPEVEMMDVHLYSRVSDTLKRLFPDSHKRIAIKNALRGLSEEYLDLVFDNDDQVVSRILERRLEQLGEQARNAARIQAGSVGLLSMREWVTQLLPLMPSRESPRAGSSAAQPTNSRTFGNAEPLSKFAKEVQLFINTLPDEPKMFKPLSFRAKKNEGGREVMRDAPADESYVRSRLITILEAVSDVAEDLGLDTEYIGGGSGRSLSFTDIVVRQRGVSDLEDLSKLLLGVFAAKGPWQLELDGTRTLLDCLDDEMLKADVANVIQQAYGDAVMDECPIMLISNWYSTSVLVRDITDVQNKTLEVASWAWDSIEPHPLGAFLYVLKLAHEMLHDKAKAKLPRFAVPAPPSTGYVFSCGNRQPGVQQNVTCSYSSRNSSAGASNRFDAIHWSQNAATVSAAAAIDALPVLPSSYVSYSSQVLSSSSRHRVCEGIVEGQPALLKLFRLDDYSLEAFVTEATTYVHLMASGVACIPKVLALGRLPHSGLPVIALTWGEPMNKDLLQQHEDGARKCLQALHNAGFAHGDVRVDNFLLIDGQVLITDLETCSVADADACELDMERLHYCLRG